MNKTGRNFENEISKKLLKINKSGRGFFIKSPTPMKMIKSKGKIIPIYSNKALCDFVGIYNKKFVLIEAKNITGERFIFERLKPHQEKQLSSIKRHGGISLIMFGLPNEKIIIVLKIDDYLVFKSQSEKKSINIISLKEIGKIISLEEVEEYLNFMI
ncbi:MAG: Holliday junction resolvase RecU [Mycoplasmataceae bacterium]|nr:Holliday junction resolvase RecU [Mycoplasmataceae bacterium]